MNLREKDRLKSLWQEVEMPSYKALDQSLRTEVCVVGGGISGVSIAYQLARRGHKVILLEAFRLGSGQTGRTTAHLTYQLEEQFSELIKHHDQVSLELFAGAHRRAIDVIEDIVHEEGINCDFRRLDGFLFLGPDDSLETLREEVRIGKDLGLDLSLVEEIPLFPQLGQAVRFPRQGQFHPMKYMAGLLRAMEKMDVQIFENSHVREFRQTGTHHRIITDTNHEVEAEFLVVATDSPVNNRFFIHTKQAAYRTYAMAFKIGHQLDTPLIWDTADPYHYIRQSGDLLIVGGEDHKTGQHPEKDPFAELERWSRHRLPFVQEVEWKWSGQVFEPYDQFGFIGRNPGIEKNVFIATGESGIGMTSATIASLLIPDLLEGKHNDWTKIFDPGRVSLRSSVEFMKENANVAAQYRDWLTPTEVNSAREVPVDQGCLMREGMTKNCIYHAEDDSFEKKSAVCTHLGGIVHWNDIEKTWDCPCHGSRFNAHGKVIEGPALGDLQER